MHAVMSSNAETYRRIVEKLLNEGIILPSGILGRKFQRDEEDDIILYTDVLLGSGSDGSKTNVAGQAWTKDLQERLTCVLTAHGMVQVLPRKKTLALPSDSNPPGDLSVSDVGHPVPKTGLSCCKLLSSCLFVVVLMGVAGGAYLAVQHREMLAPVLDGFVKPIVLEQCKGNAEKNVKDLFEQVVKQEVFKMSNSLEQTKQLAVKDIEEAAGAIMAKMQEKAQDFHQEIQTAAKSELSLLSITAQTIHNNTEKYVEQVKKVAESELSRLGRNGEEQIQKMSAAVQERAQQAVQDVEEASQEERRKIAEAALVGRQVLAEMIIESQDALNKSKRLLENATRSVEKLNHTVSSAGEKVAKLEHAVDAEAEKVQMLSTRVSNLTFRINDIVDQVQTIMTDIDNIVRRESNGYFWHLCGVYVFGWILSKFFEFVQSKCTPGRFCAVLCRALATNIGAVREYVFVCIALVLGYSVWKSAIGIGNFFRAFYLLFGGRY